MSDTNDATVKPPYLSYTTLKNFLGNFKEGVIPSRIDKSLMPGQSGATQSYILNSLQFLGLTDEKGVPQSSLQSLISSIGDPVAYEEEWKKVFLSAYAKIISDLDLSKATPDELKDKFRAFGYGGDTLRKCHVFFIAAADAGGVQLAPHLKVPGRAAPSSRRSSGKKSPPPAMKEVETPKPNAHIIPEGMTSATLPLDAAGKRYFKVETPMTIRKSELERIQSWLSFQLIVTDEPTSIDDVL